MGLSVIGVDPHKLFELIRPMYGLYGTGDYWGLAIEFHLSKDIRMQTIIEDNALFDRKCGGIVEAITGYYVDDRLNAGTKKFEDQEEVTLQKLELHLRVYKKFDFFAAQIRSKPGRVFQISQS